MKRQDTKNSRAKALSSLMKEQLFYLCIIPLLFAWLLVNVFVLTQDLQAPRDDLTQVNDSGRQEGKFQLEGRPGSTDNKRS